MKVTPGTGSIASFTYRSRREHAGADARQDGARESRQSSSASPWTVEAGYYARTGSGAVIRPPGATTGPCPRDADDRDGSDDDGPVSDHVGLTSTKAS
jgi:hypothetical protein